jgi:hypothetical protein
MTTTRTATLTPRKREEFLFAPASQRDRVLVVQDLRLAIDEEMSRSHQGRDYRGAVNGT